MSDVQVHIEGAVLPRWFTISLIMFSLFCGIAAAALHTKVDAQSERIKILERDLKIEEIERQKLEDEFNEYRYGTTTD